MPHSIEISETVLFQLEIVGLVFGLTYVIGAILEKWWCWPAGIIGVLCYGTSMYFSQMYGESMLQVVYIFISIYGWINWQKNSTEPSVQISKASQSELLGTIAISTLMSVVFYFLLTTLNGALPFWDALTNGFAIGATYLVARKKIENWHFWIAIDIVLSILLYYKGYYFYSLLYAIYTFMAILGWKAWKQKL
jgi:nicotinamide mononucleotide transporter